mmetsp:Transcript_40907/g.100935  ORF Transcript_40907/g.100935 Transcript_40907/m.100935 type:complete len:216 (+) Transcript_40907:274-921(+)
MKRLDRQVELRRAKKLGKHVDFCERPSRPEQQVLAQLHVRVVPDASSQLIGGLGLSHLPSSRSEFATFGIRFRSLCSQPRALVVDHIVEVTIAVELGQVLHRRERTREVALAEGGGHLDVDVEDVEEFQSRGANRKSALHVLLEHCVGRRVLGERAQRLERTSLGEPGHSNNLRVCLRVARVPLHRHLFGRQRNWVWRGVVLLPRVCKARGDDTR